MGRKQSILSSQMNKYDMIKFEDMSDEEKWNAARTAMDNAERRISGLEARVAQLEEDIKKLKNKS